MKERLSDITNDYIEAVYNWEPPPGIAEAIKHGYERAVRLGESASQLMLGHNELPTGLAHELLCLVHDETLALTLSEEQTDVLRRAARQIHAMEKIIKEQREKPMCIGCGLVEAQVLCPDCRGCNTR